MEFVKNGFIVICKEPKVEGEHFAEIEGENIENIFEAAIFFSEEEVKDFISVYDEPEEYIYKPIEVTYKIKNLKLS